MEFNELVAASEVLKQVEHPWQTLLQRINVIMFYVGLVTKEHGIDFDGHHGGAPMCTGLLAVISIMHISHGEFNDSTELTVSS